jgi:hypothetical protein
MKKPNSYWAFNPATVGARVCDMILGMYNQTQSPGRGGLSF